MGGDALVRDFAIRLRLAAAVLGCETRKELAAAFRRVNPHTFDVDRADKWLSGKASPRTADVYRDWSKLLAVDRPHEWLTACSPDDLLDALARGHGMTPDASWSALGGFRAARASPRLGERRRCELHRGRLCLLLVCVHALFPGRLIRGSLVIGPGRGRKTAAYSQNMLPSPPGFRRHVLQRAGHADRAASGRRGRHAPPHGAVRALAARHRARRHAVRRRRGHPRPEPSAAASS